MSNSTSWLKKPFLVPGILVGAGLLMSFYKPITAMVSPAKLEFKIQHAPVIMPAVYKVYADENAMEGFSQGMYSILVTVTESSKDHFINQFVADNADVIIDASESKLKDLIR